MHENKIIIDCAATEITGLFAELACESAILANLILCRYPEYREAKQVPSHPFWRNGFSLMRRDVLRALRQEAQEEQEANVEQLLAA